MEHFLVEFLVRGLVLCLLAAFGAATSAPRCGSLSAPDLPLALGLSWRWPRHNVSCRPCRY